MSPQSLSEADRRLVAAWAADCAERVLPLFEAEAPDDVRARDGIARARAFSRGESDAAGEIRLRFVAGRAAQSAISPAAKAAARSALRTLPLLGEDPSGPLGPGLLTSGVLGSSIRAVQAALGAAAAD